MINSKRTKEKCDNFFIIIPMGSTARKKIKENRKILIDIQIHDISFVANEIEGIVLLPD